MWVEYNPNPTGRRVEDCAIRAIAKALDTDWETAFAKVSANAFQMGDMPHSDSVWGSYARGRTSRARDGRYSSYDDYMDRLNDLMNEAPDTRTRQEIERLMNKM